jgi:anti-sigma regulatory factor (Ser/Thr protein kinase)
MSCGVSTVPDLPAVSPDAVAAAGQDRRLAWRHAAADLDAVPRSVPAARGLVRIILESWGLADSADPAELIASELLTNALRASAGAGHPVVRLRLTCRAWSLLIAVWDASPGLPAPRRDGPPDALGGRGLLLVEALADKWGCDPADGGKVVYAEIAR